MLKTIKKRTFETIRENSRQVILICSIITVVGLCTVFSLMRKIENTQAAGLQKGIANEIIRFHVIANSDNEEDQELKLKVKENVVEYMHDLLKEAVTIDDTREIITVNLESIQEKAEQIIAEQGYHYKVTAQLTDCYFPMKSYGDITFPAGEYEALRICIGDAKGKNWWCVLYPNLCFIDSIHAVVPENQKEELKNVLTEDEYDSLFSWKNSGVHIKSKILELFQ